MQTLVPERNIWPVSASHILCFLTIRNSPHILGMSSPGSVCGQKLLKKKERCAGREKRVANCEQTEVH